jgi:transcriptional regulator with XRE-family HTH domain
MEDEQGTFRTPSGEAKIGRVLEEARKERGLTLEEVEHATKIRKRYLAGMEHEDYSALPDAIYVRGFLRTYANYLGLDGEELSREFEDHRRPAREGGVVYGAPQKSELEQSLIDPVEESPASGARKSATPTSDPLLRKKGLGLLQALLVLGALVVALIGFVWAMTEVFPGLGTGEPPGKPPEGVKSYEVAQNAEHIEGNLDYPQSPPVGGNHNPVWQNCGFYDEPVRDEHAVHSMEHGAVWIAYSPELPQEQVERLQQLARDQTYLLVSPYPGLNSPVVASAWGKQLPLRGAGDPDLERFIRAYMQGPQAPEPGAACTTGVGSPE